MPIFAVGMAIVILGFLTSTGAIVAFGFGICVGVVINAKH